MSDPLPPPPSETGEGLVSEFPVSFGQERLLLLDRIDPTGLEYAIVRAFEVDRGWDTDRFEGCVRTLSARHEALRTTFRYGPEGPVQVVRDRVEPEITRWEGVTDDKVGPMLTEFAHRPFEPEHGPLFRVLLAEVDDGRWYLVFGLHHLVCDGLSMDVLFEELSAMYGGADLPPPPEVQFADFASWQRDVAEVGPGLEYWTRTLAGAPETLSLPWDRSRPPEQSPAGGTHLFRIDAQITARAAAVARDHRVTPFTLYLAAYSLLLSRLSGQDDMIVGVPTGGRGRPELENVVGFFANTVPLRASVPAEWSFGRLLQHLSERSAAALHHQDVPLERVISALSLRRDPSWHPLFQTMFSWDESREVIRFGDLAVHTYQLDLPVAKFDLTLTLTPRDEGVDGRLEFRTDLVEETTAARWARCLVTLLSGALEEPDRPVGELAMMTEAERAEVIALGRGPRTTRARTTSLPSLWAERVRSHPAATAVVHGESVWSYAELDKWSRSIADRLHAEGVRSGDRVGLCVERSVGAYAAVLAVLRIGAAYVPLDPTYPREHLTFTLRDSGCAAVLHHAHLRDLLPKGTTGIAFGLDPAPMGDTRPESGALATGEGSPAAEEEVIGVRASDTAYVIYTSGSTGRPKGVPVSHGSVVNLATDQAEVFGFDHRDRVAQFASLGFDVSVAEMWMTWSRGAALVVLGERERLGPDLAQVLRSREVTVLIAPPTALASLSPAEHPRLRLVVTTGEPCPVELPGVWGPGRRLINAYGPTEATIWATAADLGPDDEVTIGTPLPNTDVRVVDPHGMVTPLGVVGEVWLGGAGVADGYHDRADLTTERFVTVAGERMYRTGDLGRMRENGSLVLLGRADDQVKINGFRIELGEVEAVLRTHPGVGEAVAAVREHEGVARLVAYPVVPDERLPDDLRAWVTDRLPAHMVPAVLTPIAEVPLGPSGKVDRAALPDPGPDRTKPTHHTAPRSGTEQRIAEIWSRVLGVEDIGVHDTFFELGGTSLLLLRVHEELNRTGPPTAGITDLFRYPTVAALARGLEQRDEPARKGTDRRSRALARRRNRARTHGEEP